METERLLTELFDRQRFERDPALQRVIDEVEERYFGEALSDEQLQAVTAAGEPCLLAHPPGSRTERLDWIVSGRDLRRLSGKGAGLTGRTERPEDAEDLCREVFAQISRSLPRFDPEKASLSTRVCQITRIHPTFYNEGGRL